MKLYRIARDSAVALAQRYISLWCLFLFAIRLLGITLYSSRKDLGRRAFAGARGCDANWRAVCAEQRYLRALRCREWLDLGQWHL